MLGSGSDARSSSSPNLGTGGPKLASKNSRSSAASPEKNGFGWHIKSLVGADEGSAARVEAYMSLLNASRQTPEPEVPGLFSLPDFAALLSAMSQDIQKEGQPDVTHSAIRCSGFFCHYGEHASAPLAQSFQDVLNAILARGRSAKLSEDKVTLTLCIWFLGAQRLLPKQIKNSIAAIMDLLSYGIEVPVRSTTICAEACTALTTIFAQSRHSVLSHSKLWALPALMHLVHPEEMVQSRAEALFHVILVDEKPGVIDKPILDDFVNTAQLKFLPDLEKLSDDRALRAWRTAVAVCGASMHRTGTLNSFLRVIEKFFNSKDDTVKKGAYDAWVYLIYSFTIGDHLLHEKRLNLILTPYLECLRNRREPTITKLNVLQTWYSLLFAVGPKLPKFIDKIVFEVLRLASNCDLAVENKAYFAVEKLLEVPSGSYRSPTTPEVRRLLQEEPILTGDLAPLDPKFVRTNIAQFVALLVPLCDREPPEDASIVVPTADRYWQTLLANLAAQARLELNMGAEMQTSLDSLVQFITAGLQLPRRSPLATLGIKARLLGQMLNDFPQRILTSRTKSEFWGKKSNEVLERMLLSDPSAAPNWPRVRYSPLLSVAKAWTALSDENEEEGEIVIVNLFEKILDIAANSASVELYLSLLVAIEECPLPARVLPLWAALASSFAQQVEGTDDVFADDGTFYEALATLLVPLRHPTSFSEARAEAWKLFWDAFWDSARIKLKTPSVVLEQLLEKVVSLDIKSAESFGWISFCYRTLLSTAKDVAGLLASSRKRSTAALFSKLFFSLIDASMRPTAGPDALAVAADLCILTFAEIPDLLVDPRFQPLDVIDKLFASQSGVSHVVVEQLLRILANAYEKTGVSESRDRLHEFGAIIQRISKMKDVQPDISDILSRILMDAIKFQQDIPAWLRKAFAKYTDSGELDELDADDLLLSSKKQSRFSLAPKIQAARGSDQISPARPAIPYIPPTQADTQDFVPIAPFHSTPTKRPSHDEADSQEDRRRKRKASIPQMYNSLDTNSQEARAEVPFGATPRSESKKRKVADHSPLLDVNDDDAAEDLPTSPTSCHNVPRFERHAQDGNSPVKKEADDEMQMDAAPCEEDASGDAEQAGEEASESVQDLVDRLLSRKDELPKLDVRSLLAVQQELSKALVEVVARTLG